MGWACDLIEVTMVPAGDNWAYPFDSTLGTFEAIADEQPLFKSYLDKEMHEEKSALAEAQNPQDASNIASTAKTVELIVVMEVAALQKMRDPKIAIADKLSSQKGANSLIQPKQQSSPNHDGGSQCQQCV
eukprot:1452812-Pleurochrysis_carterae.AAC.2